jgi:hypothetical protein
MAQKLEAPTHLENLSRVDQQILLLLQARRLPIDQVVALVDADQSETLSSAARLIADGHVQLVISEYPWGIELELQSNGSISSHLETKTTGSI